MIKGFSDKGTERELELCLSSTYLSTVCSGTGIVILLNCDCGTEFKICSANYTYRFCRILYNNIRKKGQVKQHSKIGGHMRMVYLHEQALQTKPLEYCS